MSTDYLLSWAAAFVFTQLVEVPIYRRTFAVSALAAFGASALTHPIIWFLIFPQLHASYSVVLVLAELFAWLAEAAYFRWLFARPHALLICLAANAASLGLGMLSRSLFGAP